MPDLLTVPQVVAMTRLDRSVVQRACQRGQLKAAKLGRDWLIERADAERWSAEDRRPGRKAKIKASSLSDN
jgi:excisionase family DNA binding protein